MGCIASAMIHKISGSLPFEEVIGGGNSNVGGMIARYRYNLSNQKIQFNYAAIVGSSTTDVTNSATMVIFYR